MRKFLIAAGLAVAIATPALAQGMAGPSASGDGMSGPSHMAMGNDGMKMDHKKKPKKAAMAHDSGPWARPLPAAWRPVACPPTA